MAYNQRDFRNDKPNSVNVRTVCCFRTSTELERRES
jgi:hypothetical protein